MAAAAVAGLPVAFGLAAPSASDRKERVDERLERAEQRARAARGREEVLIGEVTSYSGRIRDLEERLAPVEARARALEAELAALRERLARLTRELAVERRRLQEALDTLAHRRVLLAARIREIYRRGEPDPLLALLGAKSLSDVFDTARLLDRVVSTDRELIGGVKAYATDVRAARDRIARLRDDVILSERRVDAAAERTAAVAAELERQRAKVARLRAGRQALLSRVRGDRRELETEAAGLRARSDELAAEIRAAQAQAAFAAPSSPGAPAPPPAVGAPSSAGFVTPVGGPITSGFGPRWGRMHEGVDIGAGAGTPIVAAASGTVIVAGWQGGYGNLVVIDHGNGVSTAYAHQSGFAVGVGQSVGAGSVIGYVGCTGHCFGDHLHFEVRIGGAPVDPLGYL